MGKKVGDRFHYSGVMHIHTTESDGTKTLESVVALGQQVGLDFMMFADHMGLTNREAGKEGMYGKTLVVIGYEHNDPDDNNHYLVYKSPHVYPHDWAARDYVAAARKDKAFGIVAHPIERRSRQGKYPPYPWLEWDTNEYDGLEIWNQMSEWLEKLTPWNKLAMAFSPRKSIVGPTPEVLRIWDELNQKRRYAGVAGVDAHAFPYRVGPVTVEIFPYKVHFKSLRTHIILDEPMAEDFKTASAQLYAALADCRLFVSNIRWGDANSFRFYAQNGAASATCGGAIDYQPGTKLLVELPGRATIKLVCDGATVVETNSDRLSYAVASPGLYRVEAWKRKRGWIFSNHIRIGLDKE
jgi:hypothetical protein